MSKGALDKLTSALSNLANRYAPAVLTLVALGLFFLYYFNVVVAANESELKERKFRALNRMANNFKEKLNDYSEKNVPNFVTAYKESNDTLKQLLKEKESGLKYEANREAISETSLKNKICNDKEKIFFPVNKGKVSAYLASTLKSLIRKYTFSKYTVFFQ